MRNKYEQYRFNYKYSVEIKEDGDYDTKIEENRKRSEAEENVLRVLCG